MGHWLRAGPEAGSPVHKDQAPGHAASEQGRHDWEGQRGHQEARQGPTRRVAMGWRVLVTVGMTGREKVGLAGRVRQEGSQG